MRYNPELKKNIKVRLQMSRSNNDKFYLTIEDEASGAVITQIALDAQAVADLISSRYTEPVKAEYYPNPNVGKQMEVKTFQVDISVFTPPLFESYDDSAIVRDLKHVYDLAEELNKGWTADRDKYNNKRKNDNNYSVTLRRYVP